MAENETTKQKEARLVREAREALNQRAVETNIESALVDAEARKRATEQAAYGFDAQRIPAIVESIVERSFASGAGPDAVRETLRNLKRDLPIATASLSTEQAKADLADQVARQLANRYPAAAQGGVGESLLQDLGPAVGRTAGAAGSGLGTWAALGAGGWLLKKLGMAKLGAAATSAAPTAAAAVAAGYGLKKGLPAAGQYIGQTLAPHLNRSSWPGQVADWLQRLDVPGSKPDADLVETVADDVRAVPAQARARVGDAARAAGAPPSETAAPPMPPLESDEYGYKIANLTPEQRMDVFGSREAVDKAMVQDLYRTVAARHKAVQSNFEAARAQHWRRGAPVFQNGELVGGTGGKFTDPVTGKVTEGAVVPYENETGMAGYRRYSAARPSLETQTGRYENLPSMVPGTHFVLGAPIQGPAFVRPPQFTPEAEASRAEARARALAASMGSPYYGAQPGEQNIMSGGVPISIQAAQDRSMAALGRNPGAQADYRRRIRTRGLR